MIHPELIVTGIGLAAYPIGAIVKLIITDDGNGMIYEKKAKKPTAEIDSILQRVSDSCGIEVEELVSKTRKQHIAIPRQISVYLVCKLLKIRYNLSYARIGKSFNLDHSTVIYSEKTMQDAIEVKDKKVMDRLILVLSELTEKEREILHIDHEA